MVKRRKIILDFDNTIARSSDAILSLHGYSNVDNKLLNWDFTPFAKNPQEKEAMLSDFQNPKFWDILKPMEGFGEWLRRQATYYGIEIYVCSVRKPGQFTNLIDWMKGQGFDEYITDYVLMNKSLSNKSILLDKNTFIIDDNPKSFGDDNEAFKVRFGDYAYGEGYNNYDLHCISWSDVPFFREDFCEIEFG